MNDIVDMAYQIIEMDRIIQDQRYEIEHLKQFEKLYFELLDNDIKHGKEMVGNILKTLLTPNVLPALEKNNPFKEEEVLDVRFNQI